MRMGTKSYAAGGIFLMIAQFINLISAFLMQVFLGIILGPADYGIYGVVISVVSVSTVFLIGGIPLSVSKFIASHPELAYTIKRKGLRFQFYVSLAIVLFYMISAPFLAKALNDTSLTIFIQVASIALLPRALSAVYAMYFNGRHLFLKQSVSWSIYGIGRLILSMIFGFFFSVMGAIIGFVIAPILSMIYSFFASKEKNEALRKFPIKKIVKYSFFAALFFLGVSIFQTIDIFLVKSILRDNVLAGYYNAALTLSKLPFNILGTVSLILFPATARLIKSKNMKKMKELVNQSMRVILIMLLPIILLLSAKATDIVKLFYTEKYADAGPVFTFLILSLGIFTIFYVYCSMILVSNEPHVSALIVLLAIILDYTLIISFIKQGIVGVAIATLLASSFATLLTLVYVYKRFKALIKIKSFFKIALSALVVYLISFFIPEGNLFTIIGLILLMIVYYILLLFIKEITITDIEYIKKMFIRKKPAELKNNQ